MEVRVGLVIFAANQHNLMNSYVLLHRRDDNFLEIPSTPLPYHQDSLSVVYDIIKECSGITGKWVELQPRQIGVFDDVDRNPDYREIFIIYSIFIPDIMNVFGRYEWVKIDALSQTNLYLDTYDIIRYAVLNGR